MPRLLLLLALAACGAPSVRAQHDHAAPPSGADTLAVAEVFAVDGLRVDPAAVPPGSAVARAGLRWADGGYAAVVYGRPYARGRVVFGGLVAWDAVWAAGAHRATELWTTVPLTVGAGEAAVRLAPGGYSLFVTPRADGRWRVHVNAALGMHLADEYDARADVATLDATRAPLVPAVEALTYAFAPDGRALHLRWADAEIAIPLARSTH